MIMVMMMTMMIIMIRDARGAYRYLRLLINVWFYEKLDLTVPQVRAFFFPGGGSYF